MSKYTLAPKNHDPLSLPFVQQGRYLVIVSAPSQGGTSEDGFDTEGDNEIISITVTQT